MADEAEACHHHETAADPEGVAEAPEDLADCLRVPTDANNPCGIHPHLGFQDGGDFQQVVGGWIEKEKADGSQHPDQGNDSRNPLQIPESNAVVAVSQEIANHHHG